LNIFNEKWHPLINIDLISIISFGQLKKCAKNLVLGFKKLYFKLLSLPYNNLASKEQVGGQIVEFAECSKSSSARALEIPK
jgi:hypothetical protein